MARNQGLSIPKLVERITDEESAYRFLEEMRWGDPVRPVCPHCGSVRKHYFLTPKNGVGRISGPKKTVSVRRVWKCADCRAQFSALTGTVFHGSKIPVKTWLLVLFEMCASKNGVSAREIERKYDLTAKTAWFMAMRVREAMKRGPLTQILSGVIVADETYIGGKPSNRHGHKNSKGYPIYGTNKTPVLALVHKESGEVRSAVIPKVTGKNLRKVMEREIDIPATTLHTDSGAHYKHFKDDVAAWESVNHLEHEYVRGDVSTNLAESYFSQLKRSIDGTHHNVSVEHLPRYLAEDDFRWSTRKLNDTQRMARLMGQVGGRRLRYAGPSGL
jgi:transposase-like protein